MFQKIAFLLLLILPASLACAQCTNGLGVPLVNETFGSGTATLAPPLPPGVTDFKYVPNACPDDGEYTIVNSTTGCYGEWHTLTDRTDPNGYFMIVNASETMSTFYTRTINGLCPGTNYTFSAYIINMDTEPGLIKPNITFTIEKTDGSILGEYTTGNIAVDAEANWNKYQLNFKTPTGIQDVVIRMRNNAPGGGGNNFAIDDIAFTPGGPPAAINIKGSATDALLNPCGNPETLISTVGSCYLKNAYQWQISSDGVNWTDIPGADSPGYAINPAPSGAFWYRLSVAETGNIANTNCRAISNVVKIISGTSSALQFNNLSAHICSGGYTMPSGKKVDSAGVYTDTLLNQAGCDSVITTVNLSVSAQPELGKDRSLCAGDSIILSPGLFSAYLWQDGSTGPNYTVKKGGAYWVRVQDNTGCDLADTVNIKTTFCSTIKIPNTFTPNGDGINDTWNIPQLQYFSSCSVLVYNRWGQPVFKSIGYAKPWSGLYKDKQLPAGVYYYLIDLKNNTALLSGFITLLR